MKHYRQVFGEQNGNAKLTREQIDEIWQNVTARDRLRSEAAELDRQAKAKREAARLLNNTNMAKRMGVSEMAIRSVLYRQTWIQARPSTVSAKLIGSGIWQTPPTP